MFGCCIVHFKMPSWHYVTLVTEMCVESDQHKTNEAKGIAYNYPIQQVMA